MSIQQVQAAHYLVRILEEILAKDETLTPADRTKYQEMKEMFQPDEYIKITKLNAILRLADSMDRSHRQKFGKATMVLRNNTLYITGHTIYDITLEQGVFSNYATYFEEVFGIHPVLKQKKDF